MLSALLLKYPSAGFQDEFDRNQPIAHMHGGCARDAATVVLANRFKQVYLPKLIWEERVAVPIGYNGTPHICPEKCHFPFDYLHPI